MIYLNRPDTDPYFNIAAEEFFLKNRTEDIVMIWQCEPAVIIGKHQNAMAEVNPDLIRKQEIPVIRRLSGGGTVYHDQGNINFTVIRSETNRERMIDFRQYTKPVIDFLGELGIQAKYEGKNNLVVGLKKFSGNSAHVYKNRVIHHGTILFDSDLKSLNNSIKPSLLKIEDKAVKSIRATVVNIRELLNADMSINEFKMAFKNFLLRFYMINNVENISEVDKTAIYSLGNKKYRTQAWNYGYSPRYNVSSSVKVEGVYTDINLKVVNGLIANATIEGNNEKINELRSILVKIIGLPHHPADLDPYISKLITSETEKKLFHKILF